MYKVRWDGWRPKTWEEPRQGGKAFWGEERGAGKGSVKLRGVQRRGAPPESPAGSTRGGLFPGSRGCVQL